MYRCISIAIAVFALLMPGILPAAPVGAIKGYVRDSSGGTVPNAQVTLLAVGTNAAFKVATDENGRFQFLQLSPGTFQITAEASGFRKAVVQGIMLLVDQILEQEIRLDVGQISDTVEVTTAGAALIEPERISTGMNIAPSLVKELPISNRNFDSLSLLTPGATPAAVGSQGGNISAAGTRPGSLNSVLDGINNVNRQVGTSISNFRIADAVQEFSVTTTGASADMGRQAGGQVSVVTKSGTNTFHGSAFYFVRNDAFEAANFFANKLGSPKRKLRQNQYGGTIGGPVKKDKLFFFYSWEGLNLNNPAAATSSVVPTIAERALVVDPIAKKFLQYFPLPNVIGAPAGTANFVANPGSTTKDNTHLIRGDYMLSSKDRFTGRYVWFGGEVLTAGALVTNGGTTSKPGAQNVLFSDTHTFSPTFIADLRVGMSRSFTYLIPQDFGTNAAAAFPELPGLIDSSKVGELYSGLPAVTITGYRALFGSNTPQNLVINTYDAVLNLTKTSPFGWTKHTFRFGYDQRREEAKRLNNGGGSGSVTINSFANFAGTCATCAGQSLLQTSRILNGTSLAYWYRYPFGTYFQDDIKVKQNLTVNVGLRYEYPSAITEKTNRGTNIVEGVGPVLVGTNQLLDIDPTKVGAAAIVLRQAPFTLPRQGTTKDKNNFGPIVGVAWTPKILPGLFGDGKTVIRAGFRVGFDETYNNVTVNQSINPPWNLSTTQTAGTTQPSGGYRWALAFDQNIPLVVRTTQAPGAPAIGIVALNGLDNTPPTAYLYNWNFGVQRQIGGKASLDVSYLGSAGHKFGDYVNPNQPRVVINDPGFRGSQSPNEQFYPLPHFAGNGSRIALFQGNSAFHGLVVSGKARVNSLLNLGGSYTYSHSIDNGSAFAGTSFDVSQPASRYQYNLERGNSASDMRQRLIAYYVFQLPFGQGKKFLGNANRLVDGVFGGWQVSGITTANTGQPFTVYANRSIDFSGFNTLVDRPDIIGSGALQTNSENPDAFFSPAYFGKVGTNLCPGYSAASNVRSNAGCAPAGRVGSSPRNGFYSPGQIVFDMTASKRFQLVERAYLAIRVDAFNAFNHTNFTGVQATMSSGQFGQLTSASAARVLQMTARIDF
ncbi:MAG: carboxypeptidase regulatory-like domain-containing protein [Bryobacteraceae bacterium]